jgi:hypothetical protein
MSAADKLRSWLRRRPSWVRFQALRREGIGNVLARKRIVSKILHTEAIGTRAPGSGSPCEVHIMLWERDYLNGLWSAKSFYSAARVDWPLYWHQGGPLSPKARELLKKHFPESVLLTSQETDAAVEAALAARGLATSSAARRRAFMLRKYFDPVLLGQSDYALAFDTDVLFFRRPDVILNAVASGDSRAMYNRDRGFWYNLSADAVREKFGVELAPEINAGLALFRRDSVDLDFADRVLAHNEMYADPWLTEQTLQAIVASRAGIAHLPPTYAVSTLPGLAAADGSPLCSKHYPGHPRPWLYREGMPAVAAMLHRREAA